MKNRVGTILLGTTLAVATPLPGCGTVDDARTIRELRTRNSQLIDENANLKEKAAFCEGQVEGTLVATQRIAKLLQSQVERALDLPCDMICPKAEKDEPEKQENNK